jgi:hypothetical protein
MVIHGAIACEVHIAPELKRREAGANMALETRETLRPPPYPGKAT